MIVYFLFIDQSVCELLYAAVHVCHLAYNSSFSKMRRVISLYIWLPGTKGFFLFRQHKCTQKADWTAENVTMGHACCENSADILGRGTQTLPHTGSRVPHCHEAGRALALTGGAQWVILILRNGHFAPLPPKEAGVQVPNSCTVRPWHCGACCWHPSEDMYPTGSPASATSWWLSPTAERQKEDEWALRKMAFFPLKKTFPATTSL